MLNRTAAINAHFIFAVLIALLGRRKLFFRWRWADRSFKGVAVAPNNESAEVEDPWSIEQEVVPCVVLILLKREREDGGSMSKPISLVWRDQNLRQEF